MAGYSRSEFENFVRKTSGILGELTKLGIKRLGEDILQDIIKDPRLRGSGLRGPSGRILSVREQTELGQAVARSVLEINPSVRYITLYPATKKALKFEWPNAPLGVSEDRGQPRFPTVFYTHVRVPIPVPIDDFDVRARRQFDSVRFQDWLEKTTRGLLMRVNFK